MAEQQQSFTPGPWAASDTRYNRDFRTCVNVMTGGGLRFVAAVSCDPPSDSAQLYANANLIAAAPALFEALGDCIASLEWWKQNEPTSFGNIESIRLEAARAALASAQAAK